LDRPQKSADDSQLNHAPKCLTRLDRKCNGVDPGSTLYNFLVTVRRRFPVIVSIVATVRLIFKRNSWQRILIRRDRFHGAR
jgi:hypothetical protein